MNRHFVSEALVLVAVFFFTLCRALGGSLGESTSEVIILSPVEVESVDHRAQVSDGKVTYSVLAPYERVAGESRQPLGILFIASVPGRDVAEGRFFGGGPLEFYASIQGVPRIACHQPAAIFYHPDYGVRMVTLEEIYEKVGSPLNIGLDEFLAQTARTYGFAQSWHVPGGLINVRRQGAENAEPGATDNPDDA